MPTPAEFMRQYRNLRVPAVEDANGACRIVVHQVSLGTYFMMDWDEGTEEYEDYRAVTARAGQAGSDLRQWFDQNRESIRTAAMGKGAPEDYQLALEYAVRSGRIPNPTRQTIQQYCDEHLGIDCSGFVTNYLCAAGRRVYSAQLVRGTNAQSYYNVAHAVNDPTAIRQGDLLVWMSGVQPKSNPGHIAVVEEYFPGSRPGGNLHVVEATGASGAHPKLLDSWYTVERIIDRNHATIHNPVMMLEVKRFNVSGNRVAVMRPV